MPADALPATEPGARPRRPLVRRLAVVALVVVAAVIVVRGVRGVDWGEVAHALGHLAWWQGVVLLAVLAVRQLLNSLPLALLVPGLGMRRALVNDSTANLVMYVAPPPADMVMRMSQFRSWAVDLKQGMAGVTLNIVIFYVARFAVPVLGLVVLALSGAFRPRLALTTALSLVVSAGLVVALVVVMRGDTAATRLAHLAARVVGRFRKSVDGAAWAATLVDLRHRSSRIVRRVFAPSLASLVGMVAADSLVVLLAVRFVGVPASALPAVVVVGTFFVVYPLTLFPVQGLGLLDTTLAALLVAVGGEEVEADLVAALIVWRVTTIIVPLVVALPALVVARRGRAVEPPEPDGS